MSEGTVLLVVGLVAGGAGRHVHELAAGLLDRGWRVRVACPVTVATRYAFADLGVDVVRAPIGSRPNPRADGTAVRALRAAAREADVVHAHGMRAGALVAVAVRRGTPVAVTLHNAAPEGGVQRRVFRWLERVIARRADVVLGVSSDLVADLRRRGARDVRLAVVASAPPRPPARTAADVRREFGDPSVLALVVGRLAPQKDLDLLLDAVAQIDPELGLTVVVAGDGPQRAALADRIRSENLPVRLLGVRDDVPDLLAAADLVVSSARWEGQPVWLQEAMHAGRPAVATDVGGTAAIVGDAGVLVPHGDPGALGDAIERLAADTELRESLTEQAELRGRTLPDRAAVVMAAEAVYADMRRGPRVRPTDDDVG